MKLMLQNVTLIEYKQNWNPSNGLPLILFLQGVVFSLSLPSAWISSVFHIKQITTPYCFQSTVYGLRLPYGTILSLQAEICKCQLSQKIAEKVMSLCNFLNTTNVLLKRTKYCNSKRNITASSCSSLYFFIIRNFHSGRDCKKRGVEVNGVATNILSQSRSLFLKSTMLSQILGSGSGQFFRPPQNIFISPYI